MDFRERITRQFGEGTKYASSEESVASELNYSAMSLDQLEATRGLFWTKLYSNMTPFEQWHANRIQLRLEALDRHSIDINGNDTNDFTLASLFNGSQLSQRLFSDVLKAGLLDEPEVASNGR